MEQVDSVQSQSNQNSPQKSQTGSSTPYTAKRNVPPQSTHAQSVSSSNPGQNSVPKDSRSEGGLCPLCRKTQLARGCGHKCGFCFTLFCSRCGGKAQVQKLDHFFLYKAGHTIAGHNFCQQAITGFPIFFDILADLPNISVFPLFLFGITSIFW